MRAQVAATRPACSLARSEQEQANRAPAGSTRPICTRRSSRGSSRSSSVSGCHRARRSPSTGRRVRAARRARTTASSSMPRARAPGPSAGAPISSFVARRQTSRSWRPCSARSSRASRGARPAGRACRLRGVQRAPRRSGGSHRGRREDGPRPAPFDSPMASQIAAAGASSFRLLPHEHGTDGYFVAFVRADALIAP